MVTADAFSSSFVPPPPSDYANAQRRSGRHCRLVLPRNLAQRRCWKRGDSWRFMFVTHCTRKEASHATSGSLFAKSMPVAICPNQTLIQPMIRRKRAMSNNASLQNEREGRVYPSGPRRRFIPSFLPSFLLSFSQISSLCFLLSVERACEAAYVNCPLPLVLHPL